MPYTVLTADQVVRWSSAAGDPMLDAALQEICRATGKRWLIRIEPVELRRGWFRRRAMEREYSLYVDVNGGEWAVTSFVSDEAWRRSRWRGVQLSAGRADVLNWIDGYLQALIDEAAAVIFSPH